MFKETPFKQYQNNIKYMLLCCRKSRQATIKIQYKVHLSCDVKAETITISKICSKTWIEQHLFCLCHWSNYIVGHVSIYIYPILAPPHHLLVSCLESIIFFYILETINNMLYFFWHSTQHVTIWHKKLQRTIYLTAESYYIWMDF